MPYVTNPDDGIRIYYELSGDGPPLVLHHGGTGRIERWIEAGYVDALRAGFRLILFDARGHGRSDKPYDASAYTYDRWVSDVVALIDHLNIERAHFFGYSHGAFVGYRMLQFAPERILSLVLGGGLPHQMYAHYNNQYELFKDGLDALLRRRAQMGNPVSEQERAHLVTVDLAVVAAAGLALRDEPSVVDVVTKSPVPIFAFAGTNDTLINPMNNLAPLAPLFADGEVLLLSGLDHGTAFRQSKRVVPYVGAFLSRIESAKLQ